MILVDTSIWIDHFRRQNTVLTDLLAGRLVLTHPLVIGELAMGSIKQRDVVLGRLGRLRQATVASDPEMLRFIGQHMLFGLGIGYLDAHLLAAVRLTVGATLWTRDKRLDAAAQRLSVAARVVQ